MYNLICPLCCQQDFNSIIALREHLLYYIYRPITCPICNLSVGGIHGLTKHLELHHINKQQVPYSEDNFSQQKDIGFRTSKIIRRDSPLPFYQNLNRPTHTGIPETNSFKNAELNADVPLVLSQDMGIGLNAEKYKEQEHHYNASTVDLSSKYDFSQRNGVGLSLGLVGSCAAQSSLFPDDVSTNKNIGLHYNSESSISCISVDLNNSDNDSSTLEGSASLFDTTSSPDHVFSNEATAKDNIKSIELSSIKFDGFQTLSDAVRAFVCVTCGTKIVGKDLYFKHIQEKCSLEGNRPSLSKVSENKLDPDRKNNFLEDKSSDYSMVKISASQSLSSCHSENNLLENSLSLNEFCFNKDGELDKLKSINVSKRCDDESHEIHKEEIKPYIHKKFDHDQERKIMKVPSSDVQCYRSIQNFQSLLVDKLNKTLESDNNKLPFMKNMKKNKFFDVEKEISFRSPSLDCDVNKPSNVASLSPENIETVAKDSSVRSLVTNKTILCKFCSKSFSKPFLLLRHQQEFHSSTFYYCNKCGSHFKSKRTLANHKGTHKEKNFKCAICSYSCFTASGLRTHVFENHSKKRKKTYLCSLCPETFKKKYGLDRHIKRKHENKRILCQFCDKLFSCKEDLNLHMVIHLNDKSLKCSYCGKLFTSLSSLKRHKSTHNSKRESFNCNKCSKIFTRKDSLQSHKKLHE